MGNTKKSKPTPPKQTSILVGVPSYDNRVSAGMLTSFMTMIAPEHHGAYRVAHASHHSSLLARTFNTLWCLALNNWDELDYFIMLHSDVVPEKWWVSQLIELHKRADCDVLSAVLPIRDGTGLTSTALYTEKPKAGGRKRKLTLSETHSDELPGIFDADDLRKLWSETPHVEQGHSESPLLVNTGLMCIRLQNEALKQGRFCIKDQIKANDNGDLVPITEPEDWNFCLELSKLGVTFKATKALIATHGSVPNNWAGGMPHDMERVLPQEEESNIIVED